MPNTENIGINPQDIVNQTDYFDWNSVLNSGEAGAGIGASIASIIPGIGTIVGSVIGFIVGLFSGWGSDTSEDYAEKFLTQFVPNVWQKFWGIAEIPSGFFWNAGAVKDDDTDFHDYYKRRISFLVLDACDKVFKCTNTHKPSENDMKGYIETAIKYIFGIVDLPTKWDEIPHFGSRIKQARRVIKHFLYRKQLFFGRPDILLNGAMNKEQWLDAFYFRAKEIGDPLPITWSKAAYDCYFDAWDLCKNPHFKFYSDIDVVKKFDERYKWFVNKAFCKDTKFNQPPCVGGFNLPKPPPKDKEQWKQSIVDEYKSKFAQWVVIESKKENDKFSHLEDNSNNNLFKLGIIATAIYLITKGG